MAFSSATEGAGAPQRTSTPILLHQGDVLLDGLVGDAEGGDHVADDAAQAVLPLENGGLGTPARPRK